MKQLTQKQKGGLLLLAIAAILLALVLLVALPKGAGKEGVH